MHYAQFCVHVYFQPTPLKDHQRPSLHLHCPHCKSIWFYEPILKQGYTVIKCATCYNQVDIALLFTRALEKVSE